jgi:hypothetical protein
MKKQLALILAYVFVDVLGPAYPTAPPHLCRDTSRQTHDAVHTFWSCMVDHLYERHHHCIICVR